MKKIMNAIMLSCMNATGLIEKKKLVPISLLKKMQLSMHLSMCDGCSNYQKQSDFIDMLLSKQQEKTEMNDTFLLEEKILKKIK